MGTRLKYRERHVLKAEANAKQLKLSAILSSDNRVGWMLLHVLGPSTKSYVDKGLIFD